MSSTPWFGTNPHAPLFKNAGRPLPREMNGRPLPREMKTQRGDTKPINLNEWEEARVISFVDVLLVDPNLENLK